MDILYAGGVNNPMDSIEQISYLLFLRLLSENDQLLSSVDAKFTPLFSGKWTRFSWGNFVTLAGDQLFDVVREAIESLHELPGLSETGALLFSRATLKIYDRATLRAVVQNIDRLDIDENEGRDLRGDAYEYLLSRLAASGTNGQFRTPRHIIDLIVDLVDPKKNQLICDPACGTAGFLIAAFHHILEANTSRETLQQGKLAGDKLNSADWKFIDTDAFTGFDNDANMVKIGILNLYLHRLENARLLLHNPLISNQYGRYSDKKYDVILANPPFAGKIQKESILSDLNLDTRDTELLFLKWFMDHLAPAGRAGVIVPAGVLFGSNKAAVRLRRMLLESYKLEAVISLPSGAFKPYSGVSTAALIFEAGARTESVWFYDVKNDGFSLDDRRVPTSSNDIPDVLKLWPRKDSGPNSILVPVERILALPDVPLTIRPYMTLEANVNDLQSPEDVLVQLIEIQEMIMVDAESLRDDLIRARAVL